MAVSDMNSDQHYFCAVSDLHKAGRLDTKLLREVPVLYRWWFPKESAIIHIIEAYVDAHPRDYKMLYMKNNLKIRTFMVRPKTTMRSTSAKVPTGTGVFITISAGHRATLLCAVR